MEINIVYAVYTVFTVFIQLCKQLNKQYSSVSFVYEKLAKPVGAETEPRLFSICKIHDSKYN